MTKKPNISNFLSFFIIFILIINIYSAYSITAEVKKFNLNDANIINTSGKVRGAIQRYTKLKILNEPTKNVEIFIENNIKKLETLLPKLTSKRVILKKASYQITKIKNIWNQLKKTDNKYEILQLSETAWKYSNNLTNYLQEISEHKIKKLNETFILYIAIYMIVTIIILSIIYFKVKKGLEIENFTDPLTKLYNRRYFFENLKHFSDIKNRYGDKFSVIFIDIDHFKKINDTYGHNKGDEILKKVAEIIKENIRKTDLAFRYGGEEIVILLPKTSLKNAFALAERIRQDIESKVKIEGKSITISLGVGEYNANENIDSFLKRVDNALYQAKNKGRNQTIIST